MVHIALVVALTLLPRISWAQKPDAAPILLAYVCSGIRGSSMSAPDWSAQPDGAGNQEVLIQYRGNREIAEAHWTIGTATPYYEAIGIGTAMRAGFSIVVFADEDIETYTYNAGTTELLYASVRSGSALLPNTVKSFRGSCKPAGSSVR